MGLLKIISRPAIVSVILLLSGCASIKEIYFPQEVAVEYGCQKQRDNRFHCPLEIQKDFRDAHRCFKMTSHFLCFIDNPTLGGNCHLVRGHTRNGNYVRPHTRCR